MKYTLSRLAMIILLLLPIPRALASSNWYVDGVNGNDHNDCKSPQTACKTIGRAMGLTSPGDSIIVAAATYHENLFVPHGLSIVGSGTATTIIDGGGLGSVILSNQHNVVVSSVTMRNGGGDGGNGIGDGGNVYNCFASMTIMNSVIIGGRVRRGPGFDGFGGAIYNCPSSTMTVINTTLIDNSAEEGGAICNGGFLTIMNSTFSGNTARHHRGGAIRNYGTMKITNSTIVGNRAPSGIGGGIYNGGLFGPSGTLMINNSTLSGNAADFGGGIFKQKGTTTELRNSIVANNRGHDCFGDVTTRGYNLSSDNTCGFNRRGDLSNTDPRLGPLQDNGGPTATMALLPGSPAIDAGNPSGCTDGHGHLLTTDQRGMPRPDKEDSAGCDIGAFESQTD
jgi:predicted outer membrane repeat protein